MPRLEKEIETLVTRQRDEGMQKMPVSAISYDIAQGILHGTLQALACASLNPIDKKNAELVTSKKQPVLQYNNLLTETAIKQAAMTPLTATTSSSTALVPVPSRAAAQYGWRAQYQSFKNFIPSQPWAGTLYGIQTNIPRNVVVFTALPLLRDELEDHFTPGQSKVIAGTGTGIVETLFTAQNRVIKTIMHTSPEKAGLSHKQVWASLPVVMRGEKTKAAIKWGAAKGIAYWVTFPVLSQLCEEQVKAGVDYFQLGDSYVVAGASYMLAGAVAGTITPLISYPLDVLEKRAILNPAKNQLQKTWEYYCRFGLRDSIKYNTHVGFIKTALPRMMISSAFFNLTMHMSKSACDAVFLKREHHHEQPVALPVMKAPPVLPTPPAPKLAEPVVASTFLNVPTQALPVATATPDVAVKQSSVVSVYYPSALYRARGLFSPSEQVLAANSCLPKKLAEAKPLFKPDPKQFAGLFSPLSQHIMLCQRASVVTPAPSVPVEGGKPKV
jgi:hypothetical protein